METNIAEILKDKPINLKLYSPTYGNCTLIVPEDMIITDTFGINRCFDVDGKISKAGECMLFPSNEMRNWSKFAWKKGDVLVSNDKNIHIIFKEFQDDTYKTFIGNYYFENSYCSFLEKTYETKDFCKEIDSEAKTYINFLEKIMGGKLNLKTLEIEKSRPEFKDGDILYNYYTASIFIFSEFIKYKGFGYYVALAYQGLIFSKGGVWCHPDAQVRYATEKEKQQLFDALAKEGKTWDAEKKQIVDLKPKWTPKPFERVVTRDADDDIWTANIFSHMDQYGEYVTVACVGGYRHCLPYNEETAKLIGTRNTIEEG